jgi:uncharacterized protein (DUF1778 family)
MTPETQGVKNSVDTTHEKSARINVRLSGRQRELIQEASQVTGSSMSEFILVPAIERAANVLASEQVTRLNAGLADRFVSWMDDSAQAIPAMKRLVDAEPFED